MSCDFEISSNLLIKLVKSASNGSSGDPPGGAPRVALICVFFTQHSIEKRPPSLWEGAFFIAPKGSSANVIAATEGGIPMSRYPVKSDRTKW